MIGMESAESSTGGGSQQDRLKPQLPPGFRFHPTDEELVVHYLKKKAAAAPLPVAIIADIDLYKFDPWELPGKASFGEEEWYFFSPRDRKYPNGARPNRAATSGYWKATGTDKPILASGGTQKVGVKKALVFYGGKPPKGVKTNWIMHEYRLAESSSSAKAPPGDASRNKSSLRLDDWVLCRIYKKTNNQRIAEEDSDKDGSAAGLLKGLPLPFLSHHAANSRSNARLLLQPPKHGGQASYNSLLDHDESFFEGLLAASGNQQPNHPFAHLITMGSLPLKRSIATSISWNDAGGALMGSSEKKLHDSSVSHVKNDGQTHFSIAGGDSSSNIHGAVVGDDGSPSTMLAGHLRPPGAHYQPQQESPMLSAALAEGGFRHPFQLDGVNWGT